jgi:short subunit dehydrogenase-like uncharacterized protein
MDEINTLCDAAIKVCDDTIKALNKISPKKEHPAYEAKRSVKNTLIGARSRLINAKAEDNPKYKEIRLEQGLSAIYQADQLLCKMKGISSPARALYKDLVNYAASKSSVDNADDFHGIKIPIPFPTPEEVAKFIKQLFQKG